ncbi:hypothetical protein [Paenibacillus sp. Mc5Re-14]|uniref:hypothetical protein n=1 Tax=Paenibacillus sp. Mc5Re-14 TaxID=1030529 RepID=UPI000AEDA4BD|nr:hypothetical protein [Paenibacillus sp. Mc5Re-14]
MVKEQNYSQCYGRCERLAELHRDYLVPREEYDKMMEQMQSPTTLTTTVNITINNDVNSDPDAIAKQIVNAIHERVRRGGSIV